MSSKTPMYKLLLIGHTKSGKGTPFRFSMKFISNKVLSSTIRISSEATNQIPPS